jgi:hypothetical protein
MEHFNALLLRSTRNDDATHIVQLQSRQRRLSPCSDYVDQLGLSNTTKRCQRLRSDAQPRTITLDIFAWFVKLTPDGGGGLQLTMNGVC